MDMENNNGMAVMPVAPIGNNNNDFGGNGVWWIVLLFMLMCGYGGGFGNNGGANNIYPWMNQANQMQDGFQNQMLNTQMNGMQQGWNTIQTAMCNGFAGVNQSISNGFAQAEIANNSRQMTDMQQNFALQSQLSQCCCDNRLATCQTQNIVQNEGASTRLAIQNQTQQIIDKMCQQEIDNLKAQNIALQNQVNMQNLAASLTQQTATLVADNNLQTQYIVNRVAPYPVPAYTVTNPTTPVTAA